jgi:hypothetical protein
VLQQLGELVPRHVHMVLRLHYLGLARGEGARLGRQVVVVSDHATR